MNPGISHQEVYRMETPAGIRITEFVRQMVQYATDHNVDVRGEFNGVPLVAIPGCTTTALLMVYEAAIAARETEKFKDKKEKKSRRFTVEAINQTLEYVEDHDFQHGGEYLGVMRHWIQRRCRNGSEVTWGSNETLEVMGGITALEMDRLAQEICDTVLYQCRQSVVRELKGIHGDVILATQDTIAPDMQCPCCMTDLVEGKDRCYQTTRERAGNPNDEPGLRPTMVCPNERCRACQDGGFWDLYGRERYDGDYIGARPRWIDNNERPFGSRYR